MATVVTGETSVSSRKGVVLVHGAGIWDKNYWGQIIAAINTFADQATATQAAKVMPVWYSDLVNSPEAQAARASLAPSQNQFMNALVWDSVVANVAVMPIAQVLQNIVGNLNPLNLLTKGLDLATRPAENILDTVARTLLGKSLNQMSGEIADKILPTGMSVAATVRDVCLYLKNDGRFTVPIRQRLIDQLHRAQQYDEIVLISHSLGTVVAFDVLNAWTEPKPKISYWFTLGCPLTKVLVLRKGTPDRLVNNNVEQWYNLYDTTDIVASPLGPKFTKPGFNLHDIFVDVCAGIDPVKSHDYFDDPTTLRLIADIVQAKIIPVGE